RQNRKQSQAGSVYEQCSFFGYHTS
ncbi:unnamed protein product, partial [Allacma fusca]